MSLNRSKSLGRGTGTLGDPPGGALKAVLRVRERALRVHQAFLEDGDARFIAQVAATRREFVMYTHGTPVTGTDPLAEQAQHHPDHDCDERE